MGREGSFWGEKEWGGCSREEGLRVLAGGRRMGRLLVKEGLGKRDWVVANGERDRMVAGDKRDGVVAGRLGGG
ncbi:hypothetical protein ACH5RR_031190 [Cinchona calisaya]|uniref:Uncharacterized protein n=1 Tax=Cinchona calisaya TaxID=153742 RepID=A0ABD2YFI8_9GENT